MNHHAIGLVEFTSIAQGIAATDAMAKSANVDILFAKSICPGKYIVMIGGGVAAVNQSVGAGVDLCPEVVVDSFVIPNVHPAVLPAISGGTHIENVRAISVIETYSVAATIEATDAAVKAASVEPIRMHLAFGIGGKSYVVLTGEVADVNAATQAGAAIASDKGFLVSQVIIPRPSQQLIDQLL